jgi:glucose/arabinose dehydrogenase
MIYFVNEVLMRAFLWTIGISLIAASVAFPSSDQAPRSPTPSSLTGKLRTETVVEKLEHPWALRFLPDGQMLVTERPGRLRLVTDGRLSNPLQGVPAVFAKGQGGLHDIELDPRFTENHYLYLCYAEPNENGAAGTAVARARLSKDRLENMQVIFRQHPKVRAANHFGCRLVFGRNGTLFITLGDRFDYREKAQDLSVTLGKIVRIKPDGTIPSDNPFVGRSNADPSIWSYGHRNIQAAALHPETGQLWTVEHGARGGDELNHPEAGKNYGWPVITYGIDYNGESIGEGTAKQSMEQPVYYWDPVIAPSGMLFYTGDVFAEWKGSLFIGSLRPGLLVRIELSKQEVMREERYLAELGSRIRDVKQGPDGLLYVITDSDNGKIIRISKKQ